MGHTPGPWEEDMSADGEHMARMIADNPDWGAVATVSEDHGHVAYCHYSNARLIAAAPELFVLLRECSTALADLLSDADPSGLECQEQWACVAECKKAIAKAEGRSE